MSTRTTNPEILPGLSDTNQELVDWSEGEEDQEEEPALPRGVPEYSTQEFLRDRNQKEKYSWTAPCERDSEIRELVKVHVKNHQDFKMSLAQNQMEEAKTALKKDMDSQKTPHKLKVSNKEIEGYVGG
ncbi:hypothetical protein PPACK8108_LOCUS22253 [Phakopsora pachyrhizi]|uniref:Uncharacterized protein n=1 Tax=Phakopsora pachyrhizi TaxID=170000 RepID=A0AAV0BPF8_PHAPC|nr:hypothetical protein PPACK8108_LOCUS22253 [Phakopsora pachyrhizi]